MNKQSKKPIDNKIKSKNSENEPLFIRYLNLFSPLPEIPFWKALFLGSKLPSIYRTDLRLVSALKIKTRLFPWKTTTDSVQLDLTSYCNLNCPNCERSVGTAPCKEYISLNQIDKFIDESMKKKSEWKAISLIGGEPTLHPQFFEVLKKIKLYKEKYPDCYIIVWTNGYGKKVNNVLSKLPDWVRVENSNKDPNVTPEFLSYNIAPVDLKKFKNANFSKGCQVTEICSICLTRYGYYPCGPGAAVDRVFGFDIGIKKLRDMTEEKLKNQLKILCRYCGYFKPQDLFSTRKLITEEKMSKSWKKAYDKYKIIKPILKLY